MWSAGVKCGGARKQGKINKPAKAKFLRPRGTRRDGEEKSEVTRENPAANAPAQTQR